MPIKYISVMRPPAWLVDELKARAETLEVGLPRYAHMILAHACAHQTVYDEGEVPPKSSKPEHSTNINIPATSLIKETVKNWGKKYKRTMNQQTIYVLRKSLTLTLPLNDLNPEEKP
jgi:hypothetical protein